MTAPLHTPGHQLVFAVNGELRVIEHPDPTLLLVDYLRSAEVGLTSTKLACGEGGCGACTVTLTTWDEATDTLTSRPVNSCLRPICLLDGQAITTTEGIGNVRDGVHPVQYEIAACNGSQCGFCTPGFVMNMFAGLQAGKPLTAREIENRFDAHICRCTGFRPILQAMRTFAADAAERTDFYANHACQPAAGEAPPIANPPATAVFPEALKARVRARPALHFHGRSYDWRRPENLAAVQELLCQTGGDRASVKLVGRNTDVGIYKADINDPHVLIDLSGVRELRGIAARWQQGAAAVLPLGTYWLQRFASVPILET